MEDNPQGRPSPHLERSHSLNYNIAMNYDRYLELQTRLEWFYDFHPEFFNDISPEQKKLLQDTFLYDAPDEHYPASLRDFYDKNIDNQPALQNDMLLAIDALYKAAGAGSLFDYDKFHTDIINS